MFISSCFEVRDKLIWPFLEYWINVMIYINVAIVPWYWNHCNYHAFHAFVIQYCYSHANKAHCCCCCCWFTYLMLEVELVYLIRTWCGEFKPQMSTVASEFSRLRTHKIKPTMTQDYKLRLFTWKLLLKYWSKKHL